MNDDAIAPVIAVMLLLAIGVTFYSVYTTTYLPALKEQAEVGHLEQVETGFLKFSSDIDNAIATAAYANSVIYSEQIPLGGGDILINSLKSSGTIQIQNELLGNITITTANKTPKIIPLYLVNISYQPMGNFWMDQGYTWQDGYVTVTKPGRNTPLQYDTTDDPNLIAAVNDFAGNFIFYYPGISDSYHNGTLKIINMSAETDNYASGNGIAKLSLTTIVNTTTYQNATVHFTPSGLESESNFIEAINTAISEVEANLPSENDVTVKIIEVKFKVN